MKKKFVLTLALVLMVAATLVAAPVTLTGSFKAGYTWKKVGSAAGSFKAANTPEINTDGLALTGDFWKVSVASDLFTFGDDNAVKGTGTIYLDKALAAQGVDMGDMTVTLAVGNSGTMNGLYVYTDPNGTVGDNSYKLRQAGVYSTSATVGYGSMVTVNATLSPVKSVATATTAIDDSKAGVTAFMLSASVAPVDGIKAAFGYTNYAENKFQTVATVADPDTKLATYDDKGAIGGSAAVDVAALAGLGFGLKASVMDTYFLGQKYNNLLAAVSGSYEDVSAYVEYQNYNKVNNLIAKVSYAGIENTGMYAKLTLGDLTKVNAAKVETTIGAGASYAMGGVTYALDGSYAIAKETFEITPSVKITF